MVLHEDKELAATVLSDSEGNSLGAGHQKEENEHFLTWALWEPRSLEPMNYPGSGLRP